MLDGRQIVNQFNEKINSQPDDSAKVWDILDFSNIYADSYSELIIPLLKTGIEISRKIGHRSGEVMCKYNLDFFYFSRGAKVQAIVITIKFMLTNCLNRSRTIMTPMFTL